MELLASEVFELEPLEFDYDEIQEFNELRKPEDLEQWRRYLWAYRKEVERIEQILLLRSNILKKYDDKIDKMSSKLTGFQEFLKFQLLENPSLKTKTGGFSVDIPDVGKFSASKESPKFDPSGEILVDSRFLVEKAPQFSKSVFNEHVKAKITSGEYVIFRDKVKEIKSLNNSKEVRDKVKDKVKSGMYILAGENLINTETGELVADISIEIVKGLIVRNSRTFSYPKG